MPTVSAVSFERYGRLYHLDPGDCTPRVDDTVLYPTTDGNEVAERTHPDGADPAGSAAGAPTGSGA